MQFKVPQNVQRKDTIIGPLTLNQLIILGVGGGLAYGIYVGLMNANYLAKVWVPPVVIISAITLAFTFLTPLSLPFHKFLMNFMEYHIIPKKRIWMQSTGAPFISTLNKRTTKKKEEKVEDPKKKQKSLEELTEILDTHGKSELNKEDKHEALKSIINANYKNKQK